MPPARDARRSPTLMGGILGNCTRCGCSLGRHCGAGTERARCMRVQGCVLHSLACPACALCWQGCALPSSCHPTWPPAAGRFNSRAHEPQPGAHDQQRRHGARPRARIRTSDVHEPRVAARHQGACRAAQPCCKPPYTPHSSGKQSRLSNVSLRSCAPVQTTDWFTSIQRCFQWSERIEQLPMDQVGAGCLA